MQKLSSKFIAITLALPRAAKRIVVLLTDFSLCVFTVWLAYYLRLGEFISLKGDALWAVITSIIIAIPIFIVSGLYRAIFRYSGWPALLTVARGVGIYGVFYSSIFTMIGIDGVPRTIGIIQPILLLLFVGLSRALARLWLGEQYHNILSRAARPRVLIYGAGHSGRHLAAAMANNREMQVVGFLDDDERLHRHVINGLLVNNPDDLPKLVIAQSISDILLAMPSINRKRRNEIINNISKSYVSVRTLPSMTDLIQGKVNFTDLRELDIDDLLGRDPVQPSNILLEKNILNQVVLVTGAGGSIGSELCRQILAIGPEKLLLVEQSEFALYSIHDELQNSLDGLKIALVPLLASIQDRDRIHEIISTWRPNIIYQAAAYKHVPLVEHNPAEGIKNNVFGTLFTAQAAIANKVSNFVLISTDKAVRPTNIMGASKRLAEMVLQALAAINCGTKFSMVRFGNVLGSSGSVVPKFRQQIHDGGPVTLTHPEITRYFMTIPEASQLVIQAGAMGQGGDLFVLDMGQPVRIMELARRMIELSGLTVRDHLNPEGDIEIKVTGLRPGEKLYEELLIGDNPEITSHPRIMKAREDFIPWSDLEERLGALNSALKTNNIKTIKLMVSELVSGYRLADEIVDWVHLERGAQKQVVDLENSQKSF